LVDDNGTESTPDENDMWGEWSRRRNPRKASGIQPTDKREFPSQKVSRFLVGSMLYQIHGREWKWIWWEPRTRSWHRLEEIAKAHGCTWKRQWSSSSQAFPALPDGEEDKKMLACPCCPTTSQEVQLGTEEVLRGTIPGSKELVRRICSSRQTIAYSKNVPPKDFAAENHSWVTEHMAAKIKERRKKATKNTQTA
jgi:hypothetical protein